MAGNLAVSFFERRTKNKLFGLVSQEEKVVWEQWILRVVVNNTPKPMGQDEASIIERQRMQVRCVLSYAIVSQRLEILKTNALICTGYI